MITNADPLEIIATQRYEIADLRTKLQVAEEAVFLQSDTITKLINRAEAAEAEVARLDPAYVKGLQARFADQSARIAELEAELEKAEVRTTPEKLNAMLDAAHQAGAEDALRWAWVRPHLAQASKEVYIQRGLAALLDGRGECCAHEWEPCEDRSGDAPRTGMGCRKCDAFLDGRGE